MLLIESTDWEHNDYNYDELIPVVILSCFGISPLTLMYVANRIVVRKVCKFRNCHKFYMEELSILP